MNDLRKIEHLIYGSSKLATITKNIVDWEFEELIGIGFWRGHDRYAHLEIKIYKSSDDYIDWKVSDELFPNSEKLRNVETLNNHCSFLINYIKGIKGQEVRLTFEINKAGFHPTDDWRKACGRALFDAFISCFDKSIYAANKIKSDKYFEDIDEIKELVRMEY